MRISAWSSDVCSSDLGVERPAVLAQQHRVAEVLALEGDRPAHQVVPRDLARQQLEAPVRPAALGLEARPLGLGEGEGGAVVDRRPSRSEEHTSELQSLIRISYAVFCLKKKKNIRHIICTNKRAT